MKYMMFIAIILAVFIAVFAVANNTVVTGHDDKVSVQAETTDMPLYTKLLEIIELDKMPKPQGELKKLFGTALTGGNFNWSGNYIISLDAKQTNSGDVICLTFEKGNADWDQVLYYIYDNKIYYHNEKLSDFERSARLISNKDFPTIVYWERAGTGKVASKMTKLEIADEELIVKDIPFIKSLTDELGFYYDPKLQKLFVVSALKGKIIYPALPPTNYEVVNSSGELYAADIEGKLTAAAIEELVYDGNDDIRHRFVWHTLSGNHETWKTETLPLSNSTYFSSLLPDDLSSAIFWYAGGLTPKLDNEGNIVFRALGVLRKDDEVINIYAVIKQPKKGAPSLLTWSIQYQNSNKLLCRDIYPTENGEIHNVYSNSDIALNELRFDIDRLNNSLIYLRGGVPYSLELINK